MTKEAFENAIAVVMAFGGSTNAVLHLLAIAHEAEVDLTLDDFGRVGARGAAPRRPQAVRPLRHERRRPHRRRPGDHEGAARRRPAARRLPHRDRPDASPRTSPTSPRRDPDGKILRALDNPIHHTGGITILRGSLAPDGAVVKSAGFDEDVFEGTARVFERERAAMDALEDGTITAGDVVVIRYEGPKGGPGMREMLAITGAIKGAGLGKDVLLLTDGRFSGGTTGLCVGPRRARGRRRRTDRLRARRRPDPARRRQRDARRAGGRRGARGAPRGLGAVAAAATRRGVLAKYAEARAVRLEGRRAHLSPRPTPSSRGVT